MTTQKTRFSGVLLMVLNVGLTAALYGQVPELAVYLAIGYLLVTYAADRAHAPTPPSAVAAAAPLVLWIASWLAFKQQSPLKLLAFDVKDLPQLLGSSFIFVKVFDLLRRAQRGGEAPGLRQYLTQMTFAPSFAMGPIAGPEPFAQGPSISRDNVAEGLRRLLVGGAMALVIAPMFAPRLNHFYVDALARVPLASEYFPFLDSVPDRRDLWLAVYCFSGRLYFAFAGFSSIAIGLGLLMGVRLPENFDSPFLARNPSEFWQRWHMSFTQWLREHVFTPVSRLLAAWRVNEVASLFVATAATMIAMGLWHGLTVKYLLFGLYHAAFIFLHQVYATRLKPQLTRRFGGLMRSRALAVVSTLVTFHIISLGWALFMSGDSLRAMARMVLLR
jgi:D-alanyl-lipoteichoic acid acyltransferase DltB (MBOAT superfamily)